MQAIWKFPFDLDGEIAVSMPRGAKVIHVECQEGVPCMWAMVDQERQPEPRRFRLFGTGHPIPPGLTRVGSFLQPPYMWHVFE